MSNFNYCPLIWMFCGKTQNKEIDRVHKRALMTAHRALMNFYKKLDSDRMNVKNLRNLIIEIFKCLSYENTSFMWSIFQRKELTYNLRSGSLLQLPNAKTTTYGTSSLTFKGSVLWNSLPDTIKDSPWPSVTKFKRVIKEWKGDNCI